ncbi:MAG: hypothetical protein AAF657_33245, partial [Acidobacteriota bacterium]
GSSPLGVLAAGLFFAGVHTGGFGMERGADVPRELSRVLQALMILLIAVSGRRLLASRSDNAELASGRDNVELASGRDHGEATP